MDQRVSRFRAWWAKNCGNDSAVYSPIGRVQATGGCQPAAVRKSSLSSRVPAKFDGNGISDYGSLCWIVDSISLLGRRPTVGPQTLDLLIGVRIPASQLSNSLNQIPEAPFSCART